MSLRCKRCGVVVEAFDIHQKIVFLPHKLVENEVYCDNCFETIEENKHFFNRVRNFFSVTKAKVIVTILLYASMILYSAIFFKPLSEYSIFVEGFIQFGFIINYPILVFTHNTNLEHSSIITLAFLTVLSVFFVLFWNYFLSCITYHFYKEITKKHK